MKDNNFSCHTTRESRSKELIWALSPICLGRLSVAKGLACQKEIPPKATTSSHLDLHIQKERLLQIQQLQLLQISYWQCGSGLRCCQQLRHVHIFQDAAVVVPEGGRGALEHNCAALLSEQPLFRWTQLAPCKQ